MKGWSLADFCKDVLAAGYFLLYKAKKLKRLILDRASVFALVFAGCL
jgi:hypothetical protein